MTNDEWEQQRSRAIMAAFQTGRPVFADSDGELRFCDGEKDALTIEQPTVPSKPSWWRRLLRSLGVRP